MTLVNADFLRKIEKLDPGIKDVLYPMVEVLEKPHEESVTRIEFDDLKKIVKDLAEAQERLAKAQERTELRVEELAKAQERTEKRLEELTKVVKTLAEGQKQIREELGGLSTTVGYTLENEAYKKLPALLEKDFGIQIKQRLIRKYITDNKGKAKEVNIYGHGVKHGKEVTIIGEAKSQLSNNKVDEFLRKKVKQLDGLFEEVFLVLVTHMITSPEVEEYAKNKGIILYYSYDF
jgi:predicted O-linked N-acetylglucosamine transferase (SPINDLY family)